jgi:hypothetical protein
MRVRPGLVAGFMALSLASCTQAPMKDYAYPAWGFRASYPAPPKITDTPAAADGSSARTFVAATVTGGRDFGVSVNDASGSTTDIDALTDVLIPMMSKGFDAVAGTRAYVATADGVLGREVVFSKNGRPYIDVRMFLANDKFYAVTASSDLGLDDPALKDFIISFHITGKPSAADPVANATSAPRVRAGA